MAPRVVRIPIRASSAHPRAKPWTPPRSGLSAPPEIDLLQHLREVPPRASHCNTPRVCPVACEPGPGRFMKRRDQRRAPNSKPFSGTTGLGGRSRGRAPNDGNGPDADTQHLSQDCRNTTPRESPRGAELEGGRAAMGVLKSSPRVGCRRSPGNLPRNCKEASSGPEPWASISGQRYLGGASLRTWGAALSGRPRDRPRDSTRTDRHISPPTRSAHLSSSDRPEHGGRALDSRAEDAEA